MIKIENIRKEYKMGENIVTALNGISVEIEKGSFVAIKGPSGSGKSTLLNTIGLLDSPQSGNYYLNDIDMTGADLKKRAEYRAKYLGFIFQNYNLIPELNILENVEIPLVIAKVDKKERKKRVLKIVEEVGLLEYAKHKPGELSGGQQQRVAIARALVKNPPLIIADEPTANLDSKTGKEILELMKRLNEEYKTTFIFATHDELITSYMKEIIYIKDGNLVSHEKVNK